MAGPIRTVNASVRIVKVTASARVAGSKGDSATSLVTSVNNKLGDVVLDAASVGADPSGSAATAQNNAKTYTDDQVSPVTSSISSHVSNNSNPHSVTKAQVGLGSVDNTSDANKPVSAATQTALDGKAATSHTHSIANVTGLQASLDSKQATLVSGTNIKTINGTSLLGSGDIPVSGGGAVDSVNGQTGVVTLDADDIDDVGTTHRFTSAADITKLAGIAPSATQNAPDADLRNRTTHTGSQAISTVTGLQTALDEKQASGDYATNASLSSGLAGKANTSHTHGGADITGTGKSGTTFLRGDNTWVVPTNTTYSLITQAEAESSANTTTRLISGQRLAQGALAATASAIAAKADASALTSHTSNTSNPHSVTKAQVGLENVDNTSDTSKPVSIATQTALDAKASTAQLTEAVVPLTRETINQNATLKSFGDSITAGVGASGPNAYYPKLIGDAKGWTVTNVGVSGARVYDPAIIDNAYAEVVDASKNYSLMIGVNNAGANATGISYLDTYRGCLMAVCAWLTIPNQYKVRAAATSRTGTWEVNTGVYGSMGQRSQTNGSTMTTTVIGTTVYIGHIKTPSENGTFRVVIDGNDYGIFNTNGVMNQRQGESTTYAAYCLRFPGLRTGPHTVVITVTSATNSLNGVYINWIGGNGFKKEINGPNLWLGNPTRATAAYYAASGVLSDAAISLYGAAVLEVFNSLAADDLSITFVDTAASINQTTDMHPDGLHPSDAGMAKIAQAFVAAMSSVNKTRDRGGSQRKNTPWFSPVLTNGWIPFDAEGSGYFNPAYMKDALGFVHLRGIVKSGTIGTSIFTLPLGFRPAALFHQICDTAGLNVKGVVEIGFDGNVMATTGVSNYMCLDSLTFEAGL